MPLPTSGQIITSQIMTQMGQSGQYHTGSSGSIALAGVGSGQLRIPTDFYGKSGSSAINVTLPSFLSSAAFSFPPTDATANVQLAMDGHIHTSSNGAQSDRGNWLDSLVSLNPSAYRCRAVLQPGSRVPTVGTLDRWMPLNSPRTWSVAHTFNFGSTDSIIIITVEETANPSNSDSMVVTLSAVVES